MVVADTCERKELHIEKKHKITTVGALREFLKEIPDDVEIDICGTGNTGFVDGVEFELTTWKDAVPYVALNIKAESGYHY